jgi:hypothetical protein
MFEIDPRIEILQRMSLFEFISECCGNLTNVCLAIAIGMSS